VAGADELLARYLVPAVNCGEPPKRPHLSVIRSCDLEPMHQADPTTGWKRVRGALYWIAFAAAALALLAGAAYAGGVW